MHSYLLQPVKYVWSNELRSKKWNQKQTKMKICKRKFFHLLSLLIVFDLVFVVILELCTFIDSGWKLKMFSFVIEKSYTTYFVTYDAHLFQRNRIPFLGFVGICRMCLNEFMNTREMNIINDLNIFIYSIWSDSFIYCSINSPFDA